MNKKNWLESDLKNWLVVSNMTWGICEFPPNHSKVWKFHLDGVSLSSIWGSSQEIQRSYLSWHWTVMQNLNEPWPYAFKNGMRNWVSFHEHSKVWKTVYWGALFVKSTVSSQKFQRKLCVMTLNAYAKFKGKLTHGLKNNIKNLVNFHVTVKSLEICTLIGYFCLKHIKI